MNDVERLRFMQIFIAALPEEQKRLLPNQDYPDRVLKDSGAFARAVAKLCATNSLADRIQLCSTSIGLRSPDFEDGLSIALASGLITWLSPDFRTFIVVLTRRQRQEVMKDPLFPQAQEIARGYFLAQREVPPERNASCESAS